MPRLFLPALPTAALTPPCPATQVLVDFHIARCNYQAAAAAQLAYARRLVGECPDQPGQLAEAQRALAAAVSCLRCAAWPAGGGRGPGWRRRRSKGPRLRPRAAAWS